MLKVTCVNNCIAKMEVGCLKHPGANPLLAASSEMETAPMAGKSWLPSHVPPHSKRKRHPSHCRNSGKREGKGVGGELPER